MTNTKFLKEEPFVYVPCETIPGLRAVYMSDLGISPLHEETIASGVRCFVSTSKGKILHFENRILIKEE